MELLEREPFLDALGDYAADAGSGNGRLVVITGEAGIGKTSLVDTFRASRPDIRWLWGACDGGFTPRPLGPLYDIAADAGGPLRDLVTSDTDRNALFAAFLQLLGEGTPTGIVIEDLHWADEATLDWLSHVSRRLSTLPALVLVTVRDDEPDNDGLLADVMGRLATHGSTRRVTLPRLSAQAVARLASSPDAHELHELTGGNPFFVGEVLAIGDSVVPPSVADVVRARVRRHSPAGQRILAGAAVLGRSAPASLIASVAGVPAAVIDECVATGTLVPTGQDVTFRHELTRRAVEKDIPHVQATELHRIALMALEREGADEAELTHHAVGAGEPDAVLRYAPRAGRAAADASAHREAVVQFERALTLADRMSPEEYASIEEAVAESLSTRDQWADAEPHWQRAIAAHRSLGDTESLARCLRRYGVCLWRLCRTAESRETHEEFFQLMQGADDSFERANAYYYRSMTETITAEERQSALDECTRIAKDLDDHLVLGRACLAKAFVNGIEGIVDFDALEEALEHGFQSGDHQLTACAYTNLYECSIDQLRFEASARYDESLAFALDHEQHTYSLCLRGSRVTELLRHGANAEAIDLALATLEEMVSPVNQMHIYVGLTRAGFRLGRPEARDWLDRLWTLGRGNDETGWVVQIAAVTAEAAWLTGDAGLVTDEVMRSYDRGLTDDPWFHGELSAWLMRLGHSVDRGRALVGPFALEVGGRYTEAAEAWRQLQCPFEEAVALTSTDEPDSMRRALEIFTEIGATPAAALVRRALQGRGIKVAAPRGPRATTAAHPAGLTAREAEVLEALCEGLTNAEIAQRLYLSPRTVDHHVSSILAKLGVSTRAEAAEAARIRA
ncbi:MAG TPA: AAA family ATPase [Marmoricola sp.]|nr:AAA family ATPase [Marmoricola sp.]